MNATTIVLATAVDVNRDSFFVLQERSNSHLQGGSGIGLVKCALHFAELIP